MIVFIHIPKTAGTSFRRVLGQRSLPRRVFSFYTFGNHATNLERLRVRLAAGPLSANMSETLRT